MLDERPVPDLGLAEGRLGPAALLQLVPGGRVEARALEGERGKVREAREQRDLGLAEGLLRVVVGDAENADDLGA